MSTSLVSGKSQSILSPGICSVECTTKKPPRKKESHHLPDQESLRQICWKVGKRFPAELNQEGMALLAVYPHLGFLQWHINDSTVQNIKTTHKDSFSEQTKLIIRVYDVTNVQFNGFNANRQFDIEINSTSGSYYLNIDHFESNLMAELGFLFSDGRFVYCCRSNTMYFDRPRKSSRMKTSGLYVSQAFTRIFPVENVACSAVFDEMNLLLKKTGDAPISTAIFLNELALSDSTYEEQPLEKFIKGVVSKCRSMGTSPVVFSGKKSHLSGDNSLPLTERVRLTSSKLLLEFERKHKRTPFECIQCHDWYSAPAAMAAAANTSLPLIAVLHSTELQRSGQINGERSALSEHIETIESNLVSEADTILCADELIKDLVLQHYKKDPEHVFVVPDTLNVSADNGKHGDYIRCRYGLSNQNPIILFAGEMSCSSGADLLMEAIPNVCREFSHGQFVFAGDGPIMGELQHRAWHTGVSELCRFTGDISSELFDQLLNVTDLVIIPARSCQDPGVAHAALSAGKPVIATHQSGLFDIKHGINGLLVYDNHGSITWGIKEMLSNPLRVLQSSLVNDSSLMRTTESIAGMYINKWALAAIKQREKQNG
ncbi:glycosyl transferase, group 1 [Chitinispirillum alkaliphilum]|nr:glycosyl transferase, group 1 [Chitinispirillum alkaliphilum]